MRTVYLAGPIRGLTMKEAVGWRRFARERIEAITDPWSSLQPYKVIDPTADWNPGCDLMESNVVLKDELQGDARFRAGNTFDQEFARDRVDVTSCDYLLANFFNAKAFSIFSVMEVAWAFQASRHVILVIGCDTFGDLSKVYDHPALKKCASFIAEDLTEAIAYLFRRTR